MEGVLIIGGGLAGLTAANYLHRAGVACTLLEATDRVEGRVKTDVVDGFRLDHGFQVLLTAYPETRALLDYDKLQLRDFLPGALLLRADGSRARIGDPLRDFGSLLPTLWAPVGNFWDKLRILRLRARVGAMSVNDCFEQPETTTREALSKDYGFSTDMIDTFFAPFFSGIFLEKQLTTSRRMFDFTFKMFGEGYAAVPNLGIEEIPKQLAANLPPGTIKTNAEVARIEGNSVTTTAGETFTADRVLLATQATGLVRNYAPTVDTRYQSTTNLHFVADAPPLEQAIIALNTRPDRLVNNICCISRVAPGYAPAGRHLLSLSVVGDPGDTNTLEQRVRAELVTWFGEAARHWTHLDTRTVAYALPNQQHVVHEIDPAIYRLSDTLYQCGDHLLNGSINAAMRTGREVAGVLAESLALETQTGGV